MTPVLAHIPGLCYGEYLICLQDLDYLTRPDQPVQCGRQHIIAVLLNSSQNNYSQEKQQTVN